LPLLTTLASLSQTPASNAADGTVDAPSTLDNQVNLLASFIALLRDGSGLTTGVGNLGQCRLTKSGANLLLSPFNGNGLTVNGVACKIPSAGVTLAPTAFAATTTYYIYAVAASGAINSLEGSTTAPTIDIASGIAIKTGDVNRTLVGMARTTTGPAWLDTANNRYVISWFNRRPIFLTVATSPVTYAGTITEGNGSDRLNFITWANDPIQGNVQVQVNGGSTVSLAAQNLDGTSSSPVFFTSQGYFSASPSWWGISPADGAHFLAFYIGTNNVNTSTWLGGGASTNNAIILG
jgi:hypothetical protein